MDSELIKLDYQNTYQLLLERIRTGMSFWLGSCVLYFSFLSGVDILATDEMPKLYLLIYLVPSVIYSLNWSMFEMAKLQVYIDVVLTRQLGFNHRQRPVVGSRLQKIDSRQRQMVPVVYSLPSLPIYLFALYLIITNDLIGSFQWIKLVLIAVSLILTVHACCRLYYSFSRRYWKIPANDYKVLYFKPETAVTGLAKEAADDAAKHELATCEK